MVGANRPPTAIILGVHSAQVSRFHPLGPAKPGETAAYAERQESQRLRKFFPRP